MAVPDVVVVGSLHLDILVEAPDRPRKGETLAGTAWSRKCGGKGHNQGIEAARHGARTAMVGLVGADDFAVALRASLTAAGVDTTYVTTAPDAGSGMSVAILDPSGDYGAVIVSGANLALGAAELAAARDVIAACRVCVLQNEVPERTNIAAAEMARGAGAVVVLNAAPARKLNPDLMRNVDVLVVNEVEADMLGAGNVDTLAGAQRAASALLAHVPAAIVTAGGAGLAVARRGAAMLGLPAHAVTVASTHGAGDAFVGALAACIARGDALDDAARYANAAAAALVATPETARAALTAAAARQLLAS